MFERFDDSAREAVVHAEEEVRLLCHHEIGVEHLLVGVLRAAGGPAEVALQASLDQVRDRLPGARSPSKRSSSGHIPFTSNAKKVLELSLLTALQLGQGGITGAHLLTGIVKVDDPLVSGALVGLGVDPAEAHLRARTWAHGDEPQATP